MEKKWVAGLEIDPTGICQNGAPEGSRRGGRYPKWHMPEWVPGCKMAYAWHKSPIFYATFMPITSPITPPLPPLDGLLGAKMSDTKKLAYARHMPKSKIKNLGTEKVCGICQADWRH